MMNHPSRPIRTLFAFALAAALALAVTACSRQQKSLEHFQDLPGLLSALQAFSRDITNRGQPLPQNIALDELVSGGYISSNSVRAFEGMEVKIWLGVSEAQPQEVLMSARLPDGSVTATLADGSVQQFSAQAFAQHLKKTGQKNGAANQSQPVATDTNQPSTAAGSRP